MKSTGILVITFVIATFCHHTVAAAPTPQEALPYSVQIYVLENGQFTHMDANRTYAMGTQLLLAAEFHNVPVTDEPVLRLRGFVATSANPNATTRRVLFFAPTKIQQDGWAYVLFPLDCYRELSFSHGHSKIKMQLSPTPSTCN